MKKAIVLGADYAYADKVMTTIKSICSHNTNIKFYLLNQDFPVEWTRLLNQKLYQIDSEIIDVKVDAEIVKGYHLHEHISVATYFRYFIPNVVQEDICVYIDSDVVVTGSLDSLFDIELADNFVAAVRDICYDIFKYPASTLEHEFNAGFMLINNCKWRKENLTQKLLDTSAKLKGQTQNGDQTILNYTIGDAYIELDETYNFMVGADKLLASYDIQGPTYDEIPTVIHYMSPDKPWNTFSLGRLREYWWHYYDMEWSTILAKWSIGRVGGGNSVCTPLSVQT